MALRLEQYQLHIALLNPLSPTHTSIPIYPPITYYSTLTLTLDHSYLVGKLTSSKIADTKVSGS